MTTPRTPEQARIALECLKLAETTAGHAGVKVVVRRAEAYLAFVLGHESTDRTTGQAA